MAISEHYQRLAPLLIGPINRTQRVYLESHLDLLSEESERYVTLLMSKYDEYSCEQQRLRIRQELLHDIRVRGSTVPAIREVYVNKFGGLMLDVPPGLAEIEQQFVVISQVGWTERMVALCKVRLYNAITGRQKYTIAPEIMAELYYCLGTLFLQAPVSQSLRTRVLGYYDSSLATYTMEHYPLQHAKVLLAIGDAYMHCPLDKKWENLERALPYYNEASRIYSDYKVRSEMVTFLQ